MEPQFGLFTAFELSPEEEAAALTLSDLTVGFIQNERAVVAKALANTVFNEDGEGDQNSIRTHIYNKGKLDAFTWLIDCINSRQKVNEEKELERKQESNNSTPIVN